jgi:hypothetical protein
LPPFSDGPAFLYENSSVLLSNKFGNNILNNPPYEKCYNKRALVLSPLISFKSLVNKGGAAGLSYDYADASTPHSL